MDAALLCWYGSWLVKSCLILVLLLCSYLVQMYWFRGAE
jgi:hypothetical protein